MYDNYLKMLSGNSDPINNYDKDDNIINEFENDDDNIEIKSGISKFG